MFDAVPRETSNRIKFGRVCWHNLRVSAWLCGMQVGLLEGKVRKEGMRAREEAES